MATRTRYHEVNRTVIYPKAPVGRIRRHLVLWMGIAIHYNLTSSLLPPIVHGP